MKELLEAFLAHVKEFNRIGKLAETQLSETGEQDEKSGNLEMYQDFWRNIVKQSENRMHRIESLLSGFPVNKVQVSQPLAFYRSLSRYIAESPPVWSAYYSDIRNCMGNIHDLLIDIDTQYKLGQHKNDS